MARDYYDVLEVPRTASAEELQQAYRALARHHHPDVNRSPDSEERFKEVNEAYSVLSDPDLRRRYDRFGPDFRQIPENYAQAAGAGTSSAGGKWSSGGVDFGGINIEDLFGGLFGSRTGMGSIPGADQEVELSVTVEEAYRGGRRRMSVQGPGGARTLEVTVPAGVTDGQRLRLAGQGGQGTGSAPAGDLYVVVRIAPHPRYRVAGRDVSVDLPLAPWEAALGTTVPIDTPSGEKKLRVPPGSSTGRRLRIRGQGLPNPSGAPGDFFADVKVVVPQHLTRRERQLFEELARESEFTDRLRSPRR